MNRIPPMTMDQVCKKIKDKTSLAGFKDDKEKFERDMLDTMIKFRYTPLELGNGPEELYKWIHAKWKLELSIEKQIIETTLAQAMPNLGKTHISIALKYFVKKFMPNERAYKILKNKAH